MSLYLLTAVPLSYILMVVTSGSDRAGEKFATIVKPLLRGVATWSVGYVLYLFLAPLAPLEFTGRRIYAHYAFRDFVYWTVVAMIGFLVLRLFRRRRDEDQEWGLASCGSYMLGVLLLEPVVDMIEFHRTLNVYQLFLLPTLRVAMVYVFASLTGAAKERAPVVRLFSYLSVTAISFLPGFVPLLFRLSYPILSYLVCFVFLTGVVTIYLYALRSGASS